ncbi:hypothetical protein A5647_23825 [Mycobacterium sp. 1100029.7]|nr:hypothetical protein A5647_23825 [Mycobacterium sp. 1100029.7]
MKPQDFDVVQLLRPIPEHNLPAGSQGAIVDDVQTPGLPRAYLVEFADSDGVTYALIHVPEDNLEVVWRPT